MTELTLLIIRHAEKPAEIWPGPGLDISGSIDGSSLVIRGWQRAGAWAALFGSESSPAIYLRPDTIVAAAPAAGAGKGKSARPFDTVTPLAAKLGLCVDAAFAVGQERELAADLVRRSGVVLVCWEHDAITGSLLPALLAGQSAADPPLTWDGRRYDVVLRLHRPRADAPWAFTQLFPMLLSGDSDAPLR